MNINGVVMQIDVAGIIGILVGIIAIFTALWRASASYSKSQTLYEEICKDFKEHVAKDVGYQKEVSILGTRITQIESDSRVSKVKIDLFWDFVEKNAPKLLLDVKTDNPISSEDKKKLVAKEITIEDGERITLELEQDVEERKISLLNGAILTTYIKKVIIDKYGVKS